MSFKSSEAANLARELEEKIEVMNAEFYQAEKNGQAFTRHNELQALQRHYEKQAVESSLYIKDWVATIRLIRRIIDIENGRKKGDTSDKLVGVGGKEELETCFFETDSRLLQITMICDDAELYPDMLDDVKKTAIIQERSQAICRAMMKKGYQPVLLQMDQEQQLLAGNTMIRQMAKSLEGADKLQTFREVIEYLETDAALHDETLLKTGINSLSQYTAASSLKVSKGKLIESEKEHSNGD